MEQYYRFLHTHISTICVHCTHMCKHSAKCLEDTHQLITVLFWDLELEQQSRKTMAFCWLFDILQEVIHALSVKLYF